MSKLISPKELAELVSGLLVRPSLLGELDTLDRYEDFIRDIGQVVADYCGGEVVAVSHPISSDKFSSSDNALPALHVEPNDSLPSLENNVWSHYDPSGWDEETGQTTDDTVGNSALRSKLQRLLLDKQAPIPFTLLDNEGVYDPLEGSLIIEDIGISFQFDGYTDNYSDDNTGFPVFVEKYQDEVFVRVYGDVNRDDPTLVASLSNARNDRRIE
ncbi:MAG: hypothetical protein OEY38_18375 [Gammaproteobacteria bacterium]|nr:hypothetical protein [Gammaproteobacteria bacterium]